MPDRGRGPDLLGRLVLAVPHQGIRALDLLVGPFDALDPVDGVFLEARREERDDERGLDAAEQEAGELVGPVRLDLAERAAADHRHGERRQPDRDDVGQDGRGPPEHPAQEVGADRRQVALDVRSREVADRRRGIDRADQAGQADAWMTNPRSQPRTAPVRMTSPRMMSKPIGGPLNGRVRRDAYSCVRPPGPDLGRIIGPFLSNRRDGDKP